MNATQIKEAIQHQQNQITSETLEMKELLVSIQMMDAANEFMPRFVGHLQQHVTSMQAAATKIETLGEWLRSLDAN